MAELAVILLRWVQFGTAAALMGSSLFLVYGVPVAPAGGALGHSTRLLVTIAAFGLAVASTAATIAQTAVMAGSFEEALRLRSLEAVAAMNLGLAALARAALGFAAGIVLLFIRSPGRDTWSLLGLLGALATASFAWSGHGATSEGEAYWVHLTSDILHALAASAWIGALFVFGLTFGNRNPTREDLVHHHRALASFSSAGTLFVLTILATGAINSWYLVGPEQASALLSTDYGLLLAVKVSAFASMLAFAAYNRFRLTPRLLESIRDNNLGEIQLGELRQSIRFETAIAISILALVAWFGTLLPPAAN